MRMSRIESKGLNKIKSYVDLTDGKEKIVGGLL